MGSEKRKHTRENLLLKIDVTQEQEKSNHKCVTLNISRGGLAFLSDHQIKAGECVIRNGDLKLKGKILYRSEQGRGQYAADKLLYQYGVVFNKTLSDLEQKIITMKAAPTR